MLYEKWVWWLHSCGGWSCRNDRCYLTTKFAEIGTVRRTLKESARSGRKDTVVEPVETTVVFNRNDHYNLTAKFAEIYAEHTGLSYTVVDR